MRWMAHSGSTGGHNGKNDGETVARGFWPKVRRTIGRVPFLDEAIAAYYCATDSKTPRHVQMMLLGALAYFVIPTDMIPDFIAGLGFTDDATILAAVIGTVRSHITSDHRARARATLDELTRSSSQTPVQDNVDDDCS